MKPVFQNELFHKIKSITMNKPANHKDVWEVINDLWRTAKHLWWGFFDWLAEVSWRNLTILCGAVLFAGVILHYQTLALLFVLISVTTKSVAGGKRSAEMAAERATTRANVEALERSLLEARMAALQAQIEPHFLFNTLALIGQLIETDPAQASKIHTSLIQYLRAALPQMRAATGSRLGQQFDLSRAYLNIMQARMRDRLSVSFDLPVELTHAEFPSMMLQTLVENAIKHGIEPKPEGGHIAIVAASSGDGITVTVTDNGLGFNLHAGDGVGLSNIRERLKVLYGGSALLSIETPLTGGAHVSIRVPKHKEKV